MEFTKGLDLLLGQWLRICLLMQGTQVQSLVWEDSTAKPVNHSY